MNTSIPPSAKDVISALMKYVDAHSAYTKLDPVFANVDVESERRINLAHAKQWRLHGEMEMILAAYVAGKKTKGKAN